MAGVTEIQGEKNKGVISFPLNNVYNHGFLQVPARLAEASSYPGLRGAVVGELKVKEPSKTREKTQRLRRMHLPRKRSERWASLAGANRDTEPCRGPNGSRKRTKRAEAYLLPQVDGDVGDRQRHQEADEGPVRAEGWERHHGRSRAGGAGGICLGPGASGGKSRCWRRRRSGPSTCG